MEGRAFPSTSPTHYDKDFPFFRQPTILGSFSVDGKTLFFLYSSQSWSILQYWSHKHGCGSAFISSGSRSSILSWIPIRIQYGPGIRIQGFNDQILKKILAEKKIISKTSIYLSLGLHKERPSYRRSLQLSKEAIQHFKIWTLNIFSTFRGNFVLLDPDPDPLTRLNPDPVRIRIRNPGHKTGISVLGPFSLDDRQIRYFHVTSPEESWPMLCKCQSVLLIRKVLVQKWK